MLPEKNISTGLAVSHLLLLPSQDWIRLEIVNIKVDKFPDGQINPILLYQAKNVQKSMFVG